MKAQTNEYGVTWATSKSGRLSIAVGPDNDIAGQPVVRVWALYVGTHDLAPVSRDFTGPARHQEARAYANRLWSSR